MVDNKKAPAKAPLKPHVATPAPHVEPLHPKIDFDSWWALHMGKIPAQHKKEVIKADMRGRGLSDKETSQEFDRALSLYGIKL